MITGVMVIACSYRGDRGVIVSVARVANVITSFSRIYILRSVQLIF